MTWTNFAIAVSVAAPIVAGFATAVSFASAISALRAKSRLRGRVRVRLLEDEHLRQFQQHAMAGNFTEKELAELHVIFEQLASDMSESDRMSVQRSLRQPSKEGERRYIKEMLLAA